MDITTAYERVWKFTPPRKCREMHAAHVFDGAPEKSLHTALFELYDPKTIREGDAFVSEMLVPGLVPIGGDRSGDRWCFDSRRRVGGTIPILMCPHDENRATYVAPSFAGLVYRLILENLRLEHLFERSKIDREGIKALTRRNLALFDRWLLRQWVTRANAVLDGKWFTYEEFDDFMLEDPSFAKMPKRQVPHFKDS